MEGYPKMACLMGEFPEVAIFRRFGVLNAQNLLYLQAELCELEASLHKYAIEDQSSGHPERTYYSKDWLTLKESPEATYEGANGNQWSTMLSIRAKLNEYSKSITRICRNTADFLIDTALVQQSQIIKLQSPNSPALAFFQRWMARTEMGNVYLTGKDSDIWSQPDLPDLVALDAEMPADPLSTWASDIAIHWYHQIIGKHFKTPINKPHHANTIHYTTMSIHRLTRLMMIFLVCSLTVLSIVILYVVTSQPIRLGIVAILVTLFSLSLGLVTGASISDIFTATSAFAAVLVVFISTNSACPCAGAG